MDNIMKAMAKKKKPATHLRDDISIEEEDDSGKMLAKQIDEMLLATNGYFWKQSDTFAPSGTNPCPRYSVYRFNGYNQHISFPAMIKRIFDLGNKIEDQVGELLRDLGVLVDEQIPITIDDPPVFGYIDFLINFSGHKIVECKSINDNGFRERKKMNFPKDEHYTQIQMYMRALNIDEGYVLYYNKNNSLIHPIHVKKNDKYVDNIFEKWRAIRKVYEAGDIPVRPYKKSSAQCKKCDAKKHCWEDEEVGVEIT